MRTGLIIINAYQAPGGVYHQIERLQEVFQLRGIALTTLKTDEIMVFIKDGNLETKLPKCDFIIYLDKDRYIALMLEKAGYRLFNSAKGVELCDDKMLTHLVLSNAGIKMPATLSAPLCYHDDGGRKFVAEVEKILSFPIVAKENFGSLGKQVYLVENHEQLLKVENELIYKAHIYQEFIKSSAGFDFRLIVIGGKVVATMKRENKKSFISNLANGGTASIIDLPKEYIQMAQRAADILNLDYCGIDLLKGAHGEPILSEVNSNAFFEGIEKTTGIDVAGLYADYIIAKIYR